MDKATDVIMVGFGGAGAAAAIEAADAGAEVLILEKMRKPGGATYMSGGAVCGAGASVQKAAGISDTADEMYKYMMATDNVVRDSALARVLAEKSAEAVEWLMELGVRFGAELTVTGAEAQYAHVTLPKPRGHWPLVAPGQRDSSADLYGSAHSIGYRALRPHRANEAEAPTYSRRSKTLSRRGMSKS